MGTIGTAYIANITKYKPLFVFITLGLLYWSYTLMEKKNPSKVSKIIYWASAVIAVLLVNYPTIGRLLS